MRSVQGASDNVELFLQGVADGAVLCFVRTVRKLAANPADVEGHPYWLRFQVLQRLAVELCVHGFGLQCQAKTAHRFHLSTGRLL